MTTHPEGGYHESLIAAALEEVEDQADRERMVVEYGEVLAELKRCPGAMLPAGSTDEEPEPAVRWSPWARGRLRCDDHAGHIQHRFRMLAQRALDAEDPLWKCWHALAQSRQLWEATRDLESLPSVTGEE